MTKIDTLTLDDLALFADLGTSPPREVLTGPTRVTRMIRHGYEIELVFHLDGTIIERTESGDRRHIDVRALLASPKFGDLGRWADAQTAYLGARLTQNPIPIFGILDQNPPPAGTEMLDSVLRSPSDATGKQLQVLLIDGPAGIGKTSLISTIAYGRATRYKQSRDSLILHVESRGRVLQNIMDLMAFSLQTLRVGVTYDQVPVLVRHGLLTLAIDGFDELADPNGYELAWAQVNGLITAVRGHGSLLLAGRETFIGRDRLLTALTSFQNETDELHTYTIQPITPSEAKNWLRNHGWADSVLNQENVEPLFEPGSYALRPFFLSELIRPGLALQVESSVADDLMWLLVDLMIKRESGKFGIPVEAATTEESRCNFLRRFLGEVARDLAENQTEAIASDSLAWIAAVAASEMMPEPPADIIRVLQNRAGVVAFLTDDDRYGFKRFSHAQILNHFLSITTIDAIVDDDIPKYIRRNILGADFLASFSDVIGHVEGSRLEEFTRKAVAHIERLGDSDRSRRNLATLVILTMSVIVEDLDVALSDISIDEALVVGTTGSLTLKSVVIAQLDARKADLSEFKFDDNCHVYSLMADHDTRLPCGFPIPQRIQMPDNVLTDNDEISRWLSSVQPGNLTDYGTALNPTGYGLTVLLDRACRNRSFWMRDGEEKATRRILQDPLWNTLRDILTRNGLLTIRNDVPASGKSGEFFHIRRKDDILRGNDDDEQMRAFRSDLERAAKLFN